MSQQITDAQRAAIRAFPPGTSARHIGAQLGLGHDVVARARRGPKPTEDVPTLSRPESTPLPPGDAGAVPPIGDPTDMQTLDGLLLVAERALRTAEARGDLAALSRFATLGRTIHEAKRKALPKDPDLVTIHPGEFSKLATVTVDRTGKLMGDMFHAAENWPKCPTCRQTIVPTDDELNRIAADLAGQSS